MGRTRGLGRVFAAAVFVAAIGGCSAGVDASPTRQPSTPTLEAPAASGVVARLPLPQYGRFSWSADGASLLVADQNGSTVYDRRGHDFSTFAGSVGWLDPSHVVGPGGSVALVQKSQGLAYSPNSWVVGSGHGAAIVVVAVPACVGDPIVDWYRDGTYRRTQEKLTPFGWSPDGRYVLEGHLTCSGMDAELHGWKGVVDIVDFASGKTVASLTDVRGEMAFSPSGTRLAAQSDGDVELADLATGMVSSVKNARFLAWTTDHTLALRAGETLEVAELLGGLKVTTPEPSEILMPSSVDGVAIGIDVHGKAIEIRASGSSLLALGAANLTIDANEAVGADEHEETRLAPSYWSPDGRMVALPSTDGSSIVLVSVSPAQPAQP